MAFTDFFFISPLSDHLTRCQLGEHALVWEAALCHSDTAVALGELQEQGLSAGAVCLLKYAGVCPVALLKMSRLPVAGRTLQMAHDIMTPSQWGDHCKQLMPSKSLVQNAENLHFFWCFHVKLRFYLVGHAWP